MADQRDEPTWVVVELTRLGEQAALDGTLDVLLRKGLKVDEDFPVFVPVTLYRKSGQVTPYQLLQGYAFLGSGLDDVAYFALEDGSYVKHVMSTRMGKNRFRYLSVITDDQIQEMRRKLREMVTADLPRTAHVRIVEGPYRGLDGRVTGINDDDVHVFIRLRSLEIVATTPRIFVEEIEEG